MAERDAGELYGDAHVRSYRETGGEYGHLWRGAPTLLLTTKGARTKFHSALMPTYNQSLLQKCCHFGKKFIFRIFFKRYIPRGNFLFKLSMTPTRS